MTIIIVEGPDGAGKTTLINRLQKDLNVITIKSPRPRDYHDCKDLLARTMLIAENTNILCDRIGIISEPIYGPICRGTHPFPTWDESHEMLALINPIIIWCQPDVSVCEDNLDSQPQMNGVIEHIDDLCDAYSKFFGGIDASVCVLAYDYKKDLYDDVLAEVRDNLDNHRPHPLDREVAMVQEFHTKFGVDAAQLLVPGLMDVETFEFRRKFLREEVEEFIEAYDEGDLVKMFDSLLDLTYVAKGTALFMGITSTQWALGFDIVHHCNMQKQRTPNGAASKRGSALDVIKPKGWLPPEPQLKELLNAPETDFRVDDSFFEGNN
jgi:predicted HAD superfamily Cof-like phosphohydrolase